MADPTSQPKIGQGTGYTWIQSQPNTPLAINPDGGNVGIGTASPLTRLHASIDGAAEPSILTIDSLVSNTFADVTQGIHFFKTHTSGKWGWKIEGSGSSDATAMLKIISSQAGSDIARLTIARNSGNVGIGTTGTPAAKLEVNGDIKNHLAIINNGGYGDSYACFAYKDKGTQGNYALLQANDGQTFLNAASGKPICFRINNADKMILDKDGNVGIGTTDPGTSKLKVEGTLAVTGASTLGTLSVSGTGNVGIGTPTAAQKLMVVGDNNAGKDSASGMSNGGQLAIKGNAPQLDFIDTEHNDWSIHVNDNRMYFIRQPWNYTDLVLDGNGNVGIGTTDPGNVKLKVEGNAHITGTLWANTLVHHWAPGGLGWVRLENRAGNVTGNASTGGPSDLRFKTTLRPICNALEKVLQLHGVCYRWGETGLKYFTQHITETFSAGPDATEDDNRKLWAAERQKAYQALSGDKIGLIAQELETVVPEVVHEDEEGYKYIQYQQLTALLVEAIKEQNALLQSLSGKVAVLEGR